MLLMLLMLRMFVFLVLCLSPFFSCLLCSSTQVLPNQSSMRRTWAVNEVLKSSSVSIRSERLQVWGLLVSLPLSLGFMFYLWFCVFCQWWGSVCCVFGLISPLSPLIYSLVQFFQLLFSASSVRHAVHSPTPLLIWKPSNWTFITSGSHAGINNLITHWTCIK